MKAVKYDEYGDADVMRIVEADEPHAGRGEIRVMVRAAGVNAMDWKIRAGNLRDMISVDLPAGCGLDASGTVDEVGDGVTGVAVGDAVFGTGAETYAEYAVLTDWATKPSRVSFAEAAGYPVAVMTAQRILDLAGVTAGQTVLMSGAAGGVGTAAVQFALARGLTVIGTASEANQGYLRGLGALATTYDDGWVDRVRALAPQGIDAAFDLAGAGVLPELIELTGDPAKVITIADFGGGELGVQVSSGGGDSGAALAEAARQSEAGAFSIPVANLFKLEQAAKAHRASQTGHVAGRTVLVLD